MMKYYINSETMGVKWMESIFTVFKWHGESLPCQSPWERERGEHIPVKMKSQKLRKDQEGMMRLTLAVCSRRSCICKTISRTLPLDCIVACRMLNRDRRSTTAKGCFLGPRPHCLPTYTGGTSLTLQSISP